MTDARATRLPARRPLRASARVLALGMTLVAPVMLAGCGSFGETLQRGYVLPEGGLEQIPIGATQEQVLIVLGTPSTVATVSGDVFYYISQQTERAVAFMPRDVKNQRVIAVYFDKDRRVQRLAGRAQHVVHQRRRQRGSAAGGAALQPLAAAFLALAAIRGHSAARASAHDGRPRVRSAARRHLGVEQHRSAPPVDGDGWETPSMAISRPAR